MAVQECFLSPLADSEIRSSLCEPSLVVCDAPVLCPVRAGLLVQAMHKGEKAKEKRSSAHNAQASKSTHQKHSVHPGTLLCLLYARVGHRVCLACCMVIGLLSSLPHPLPLACLISLTLAAHQSPVGRLKWLAVRYAFSSVSRGSKFRVYFGG